MDDPAHLRSPYRSGGGFRLRSVPFTFHSSEVCILLASVIPWALVGGAAMTTTEAMADTRRQTAEQSRSEAVRKERAEVHLPFVGARFHVPAVSVPAPHLPRVPVPRVPVSRVPMPRVPRPRVAVPRRAEVRQAAGVVRSFMPPPERVAFYGGLGVMAVVGVLEWPVAVAVGAGTVVAQRARQAPASPRTPLAEKPPTAPPATAPPAKAPARKDAGSAARTPATRAPARKRPARKRTSGPAT
jgi:hypothetical protein